MKVFINESVTQKRVYRNKYDFSILLHDFILKYAYLLHIT